MTQKINTITLLVVAFMIWFGVPANAQNFSCSYGKRGACLGYNDKVVSSDAICFDSYTCNYEGFTCKSSLTDLGDEYDDLVGRFNNLLDKHNRLIDDYNILLEENNDLVDDYNRLLKTSRELEDELNDLKSCILYSDDLDDARSCLY